MYAQHVLMPSTLEFLSANFSAVIGVVAFTNSFLSVSHLLFVCSFQYLVSKMHTYPSFDPIASLSPPMARW